jgi:hypothetical protein
LRGREEIEGGCGLMQKFECAIRVGEFCRGFVYVQTRKERPAHVIKHLPVRMRSNGGKTL